MKNYEHIIINHNDVSQLIFGQQHVFSQEFFKKEHGQCHTIYLEDFPHYKFLNECMNTPARYNIYSEYLEYSWKYYSIANTLQNRQNKIKEFLNLYNSIDESLNTFGIKDPIREPIIVCERPDGKLVIVDGNHRASIAYALGLNIKAIVIPLSDQLSSVVSVPGEFFGTKRFGKPYQSIFYKDKMIVEGRRCDVYKRMDKIRIEDIKDKTILDLGCNIGMSSFLSAEKGAKRVLGVEYNFKIVTGAIRLNSYFAYNTCDFIQHDLNEELDDTIVFDTVFCFSVLGHLKTHEGILKTLKKTVGKVLYFEGHAGTTQKTYDFLLNNENFKKIEQLEFSDNGIHSKESTRPFFRCEK